MALALLPLRRVEEGLAAVKRAAEIDPHAPALHSVHAAVLEKVGRHQEAKAALHGSLRASLEDAYQAGVVDRLVRLSADGAERERELSSFTARSSGRSSPATRSSTRCCSRPTRRSPATPRPPRVSGSLTARVARREAGDGWLAPLRRMLAELGIR